MSEEKYGRCAYCKEVTSISELETIFDELSNKDIKICIFCDKKRREDDDI